jgi:hypothetical protein
MTTISTIYSRLETLNTLSGRAPKAYENGISNIGNISLDKDQDGCILTIIINSSGGSTAITKRMSEDCILNVISGMITILQVNKK